MPNLRESGAFDPKLSLNALGALKEGRWEIMALMAAEGISEIEIWKATAKSLSKESRRYGRRILTHKVFLERVKVLTEEKQELELDPVWGEARWQVNQLYRTAVALQDHKTMLEAVKMRVQIADKMSQRAQATAPPASAEESTQEPARGPGAPRAENKNASSRTVAQIKSALMKRDRQNEEDEDEEGAEDDDHDGEPLH